MVHNRNYQERVLRGMRNTFAVGRLNRKTSELVLRTRRKAPFPGPWQLHAVVSHPGARLENARGRKSAKVLPFPGVETGSANPR